MPLRDVALPISRRTLFLLMMFTFAFKLVLAFHLASLVKCTSPDRVPGRLAVIAGDTSSYLLPFESYLARGEYAIWYAERKVVAGRMPHYGMAYYLIRRFANSTNSLDLVVVSHILLESAAALCLALLAQTLCGTRRAFWLTLVLAVLTLETLVWSLHVVPESFATSMIVILLYLTHRLRGRRLVTRTMRQGFALGLLIVLKPYVFPLLPVAVVEQGWSNQKRYSRWRTLATAFLAMSIPPGVLIAPWLVRNMVSTGRLIPFQSDIYAGYPYNEADLAFRRFLQAWGGSMAFWDKRGAACYFTARVDCVYVLPEHSLASGYSRGEVEKVREAYLRLQEGPSTAAERAVVAAEFERLADLYRTHRPFGYYVLAPLRLARQMVLHSGSYYLPIAQASPCYSHEQWGIKIAQSLLYYSCVLIGSFGIVWLVVARGATVLLIVVPLYLIVLFAFVVRLAEPRYFNLAHPILLLGLAAAIDAVAAAVKARHRGETTSA